MRTPLNSERCPTCHPRRLWTAIASWSRPAPQARADGTRGRRQDREPRALTVVEVPEAERVRGGHDGVVVEMVDGGEGRMDLGKPVAVGGEQPPKVLKIELALPLPGVPAEEQRL